MVKMVQAVCKNTFISFVAELADDDDNFMLSSAMLSPRLHPRSRSAETTRCRPEAEEFQELTQPSLLRLNAVLSVGMSSPPQLPQKAREVGDGFKLDQPAAKIEDASECSSSSGDVMSELRSLQAKLGMALGSRSSSPLSTPQLKPWDKDLRVSSNCSLSTMAPDDASDCGELRRISSDASMTSSAASPLRMKHAWSSGSLFSMASDKSDWNDLNEEDEDVEFELDIEAGAAAACEAADAPRPTGDLNDQLLAASRSKALAEMCHSQVPKNKNMEHSFNCTKDDPPTTMMIRNIPGRYSQNDLMLDLKDLGLAGSYDFLYMPMDKGTAANVGYAFVNFINHFFAEKCMQSFTNYRFARHQRASTKLACVSVAHLQGLEKNLEHYENAAVNLVKEKRRRPVVVANIASTMFG